ncbi:DUF4055 domain-containing protein [Acinetobacter baumannii]
MVIREFRSERGADGFSKTEQEQYRVLRLEQEGNGEYIYSVQVYTKGEKGNWVGGEKKFPTDYNGNFWTYIPFTFVGAIDNSEEIKKPPLLPLANLNLAHYRDSADFQESVFLYGATSILCKGCYMGMVRPSQKRGIYIGAKVLLPLPENGGLGIVQADPNTLAREAMKDKWEK